MDRNSDLSVNVSVDEDCILAMTLNPGLARREGLRGLERLIVITWGYFSKAPEFFDHQKLNDFSKCSPNEVHHKNLFYNLYGPTSLT